MESPSLDKIKRLAITAMVLDDDLMNTLVLKGGNAIDLLYKIPKRRSIDIDFSIEEDFTEDLEIIKSKIFAALKKRFAEEGLRAYDIKFKERPEKISEDVKSFWGGYAVNFKVITKEEYDKLSEKPELLSKSGITVGPGDRKIFEIEISKYEYCSNKCVKDLDGYTVYVYPPEMIVIEKIRAICQQMREYQEIIKSKSVTARAKDFYDIDILLKHFKIDLNSSENKELLKIVFKAKKVPLKLLKKIREYKELHSTAVASLQDTVDGGFVKEDFDDLFDHVVDEIEKINL